MLVRAGASELLWQAMISPEADGTDTSNHFVSGLERETPIG
jgi:hypothetical protein